MEKSPPTKSVDKRNLGDQWLGWDGDQRAEITSAETTMTVVVVLAGIIAFLFVALLFLLLYLIAPRLEQFHPSVPWIVGALIAFLSLFVFAIGGSIILTLVTKKNYLVMRNPHRLLLGLVSILHRLGKKLGFSSDRVSNSLLKLNNTLLLLTKTFTGKERILLLLPRCLTKEIRQEILDLATRFSLPHAICSGGEGARKKILLEKPELVVAVACERDLIAGIRDIKGSLPVIGIPNSRPKGPCQCTEIDVKSLVRVLKHILNFNDQHNGSETTAANN